MALWSGLITDDSKPIQIKYFNEAQKPNINTTKFGKEYIWDIQSLDYKTYENNIPSWFDFQKHVQVTTFENWEQVKDWALPLFDQKLTIQPLLIKEVFTKVEPKDRILEAIRFVQDEIRYLGQENGISAYKPHDVNSIFKQRFGDCKDKSFLLVSILRHEGLDANPLLVTTTHGKELPSFAPGYDKFDHCVVQFIYKDKEYFVDPTISNQGGDLDHIYFPDYKKGLLIKNDQTSLIDIPNKNEASILISETIKADKYDGDATFFVRTEYSGRKADETRSSFNSNSNKSMLDSYLSFYRHLYPKIEVTTGIKVAKDDRKGKNIIVIEEYYKIVDFWKYTEDSSQLISEFKPLVLEDYINFPASSVRTMPYQLGQPFDFDQTTKVILPDDWLITESKTTEEDSIMFYENSINYLDKTIIAKNKYVLKKEDIPPDQVEKFISKNDKILQNLGYILTSDLDQKLGKFSWISLLILLSSFGLFAAIAKNLYINFSPESQNSDGHSDIRGLLFLPLFGLLFSIVRIINELFSSNFFNPGIWQIASLSEGEGVSPLSLIVGFELVYNAFLLVFIVLLVVLFLKKRTSLPPLICIFYVVNAIGLSLDNYLASTFLPDLISSDDIATGQTEVVRTAISGMIWIPYFLMSKRSKDTFTNVT